MRLLTLFFVLFTSYNLAACDNRTTSTDITNEHSQLASKILKCIPKRGDGEKMCENLIFKAPETVIKVLNGMDLSSLRYVNAEKESDELIRLDFRCDGRMTAHIKVDEPNVVYLSIPLY
jgi:hypothetical protein